MRRASYRSGRSRQAILTLMGRQLFSTECGPRQERRYKVLATGCGILEKGQADLPKFHIGRYKSSDSGDELRKDQGKFESVPWTQNDEPSLAFGKLVNAVWEELDKGDRNPRLDKMFDYYLLMVWELSLAIPVTYIEGHPFDTPLDKATQVYELPGSTPSSARPIQLSEGQTIRDRLGLADAHSEASNFRVIIDDLELRRPLVFRDLPATSNKVKSPMLFVGQLRETFPGVDRELSGWAVGISGVSTVGTEDRPCESCWGSRASAWRERDIVRPGLLQVSSSRTDSTPANFLRNIRDGRARLGNQP